MAASRSSRSMAQRTPNRRTFFLMSASLGPVIARFKVGRVSLQRPCCPNSMTFSVVKRLPAAGGPDDLRACALRDMGVRERVITRQRVAISLGRLNMSSRRRIFSMTHYLGNSMLKIKMRQAGVYACLIIRCLLLVVELQCKLNVSRILRVFYLAHRCSNSDVTIRDRIKVDMVERVQEVRSELQLEPLCNLEVLLQAKIQLAYPGLRSQPSAAGQLPN